MCKQSQLAGWSGTGVFCKKSFILVLLAALLLLSAGASISEAAMSDFVYWYNDDGNTSWSDPNNWRCYTDPNNFTHMLPHLPLTGDTGIIQPGLSGKSGPVFDANDGIQTTFFVVVGCFGYTNSEGWLWSCNGEMTMSGGTIMAPYGFDFNKNIPVNTKPVPFTGPSLDPNAHSIMNMSGGLLHLGPWPGYVGTSSGFLGLGRVGTATFNMTGGTIECVYLVIPTQSTFYGQTGTFNLDGGVINVDSGDCVTQPLLIVVHDVNNGEYRTGRLNITKGRLILNCDRTTLVNGYIGSGVIVAYPGYTGRCIVNVDFDNLNEDRTTVTASRTELTQAWNPKPADTNLKVDQFATLTWSPGDGAISHKVYFGMDFNDVNDGIVEPVTTEVNSYNPGGLSPTQTYYWRVDEFDGSMTYKGVVWSFTVAYNPFATNPQPADGVTGIVPDANPVWTAGDQAIAHDVYLGTSFADVNSANNPNVLPGRGRQTATSYDPGTLALGQEYYWRIDEFDGNNVHKGTIWSFEVVSNLASRPSPFDGGRYVAHDIVLRWSAGYGAISHDVYIGTDSSDVNDGTIPTATTTQTGYNPGGLQSGQTYYWRIDEFDGTGKYKGPMWSFMTEPEGFVRAFPGAEGYGAYSEGGRSGDVYHVTNLADYNDWKGENETPIPGSLRYGLRTATGPRTIVFDVSGYIDLHARLEFGNHNLTIAGQTAPGDGITICHWDMRLYQADNVIIRFLRIRPGYFADQVPIISRLPTDPNHLNGGLDCLSIEGSTNIIIDHCSFSWSPDEMHSVTGDSNDITVQWNFITEPLNWNSRHAYCSLLRPAITSRITHHHNFYGDCIRRLTRFGNYNDNITTRFDWVNNVAFNWGGGTDGCTYSNNNILRWNYVDREGTGGDGTDGEFPNINLINNYFIARPSNYQYEFNGGNYPNTKIWVEGNYWNGSDSGWTRITNAFEEMSSPFIIDSPIIIDTAADAYNHVLTYAGNWIKRDSVDTRLINQVVTGTGAIINYPSDVGGFPTLNSVSRPAGFDTDGDGMPDAWEIAHGLNLNDANDGPIVSGSDGYTNLEKYLNYLASGGIKGDFEPDGDVDWTDLGSFAAHWLDTDCAEPDWCEGVDFNHSTKVDFSDFSVLAENWLYGTE